MNRLLPLFLVLLGTAALAQEIPISDPTFQNANGSPSVVASGDAFITVWSRPGIFGAVTDVGGGLRHDTTTISLTGNGKAIAGNPRGALVAWIDAGQAYTALFSRDGEVLNRTPLAPMTSAYMIGAWNGGRFLLLVTANESIIAYLFDEEGRRVGDGIGVDQNLGTKFISADPGGFLFLQRRWEDQTLWARRIDSSGALSELIPVATGVGLANVAVYFDGTHHVIFWEYQGNLHRILADGNGTPVAPQVDVAASITLVDVVPVGANALLLLDDIATPPSLALVSPSGTMLQDVALSVRPNGMATIGHRVMLVDEAPTSDMNGRFVDVASSITVGQPFSIAHQATEQTQPQMATNGEIDFVAWYENGATYGARIDSRTRRHLDGRGLLLDSRAYPTAPAVVAVGDIFLVAYLDISTGVTNLKVRRVGANGALLDPAPILVSATTQPYRPRIATDGKNALVVWTDTGFAIRGARITSIGTILDPAQLVFPASDDLPTMLNPDVAFNGETYLVVWQQQRSGLHFSVVAAAAARVSPAGVVLDPPIRLPLTSEPRVAANGLTFGVVDREVALVTVDAAGVLGPKVLIAQAPLGGDITSPTIAPSRDGFLIAYSYRPQFVQPLGLRAVYVEGASVAEPFDPRPAPTVTQWPSLIPTPHGLVLVYSRSRGEENFGGSMRAQLLLMEEPRRRAASR